MGVGAWGLSSFPVGCEDHAVTVPVPMRTRPPVRKWAVLALGQICEAGGPVGAKGSTPAGAPGAGCSEGPTSPYSEGSDIDESR